MKSSMPPQVAASLGHCEKAIEIGSRSFSAAARLFSPETRRAAVLLYGWCRYCDDLVDGDGAGPQPDRQARLNALVRNTQAAFAGRPQSDPVFIALQYVAKRYCIPEVYALDLLEGMAMDLRGTRYDNFDDLLLYCYRVAGTVGLMMAHVMCVSRETALRNASDLGIAMQLTNIARDVVSDAANGRIYLPLSWLADAGLPPDEIAEPRRRTELASVVSRLLREADRYYRSADSGLRYLSFRSACAVSAARMVYDDIGRLVEKKGARAWDRRAATSTVRKAVLIASGVWAVLVSAPRRLASPWKPAVIGRVLTFSAVYGRRP